MERKEKIPNWLAFKSHRQARQICKQIWNTGANCILLWKISAVHFKTYNRQQLEVTSFCRHSLVGEEFVVKIKEAIIGIRPTGSVISRKMVIIILIGNGMLKVNNSNNLSEFGIGIMLTGNWARGVLRSINWVKQKGNTRKVGPLPNS